VERVHGTHQDRLVKKLRREKISTHEAANAYLEATCLPEHNRRFARPAATPEDYHRRAPQAAELDRIFRLESERVVSADGVVRYGNRFYQLDRQRRYRAPAQGKVLVCEGQDGSLVMEYRGQTLSWHEIPAPVPPKAQEARALVARVRPRGKPTPAADHPWRRRHPRRGARKVAKTVAPAPTAPGKPRKPAHERTARDQSQKAKKGHF
jgi:hypothetical protein